MIGYLANTYFYPYSNGMWSSADDRADLNVVLWEIAHDFLKDDSSSLNLGSGSFQSSVANSTLVSNLFTEAYNNRDSGTLPYVFADSGQEILAPVPEPGTILLLGLGLAGLAGYTWRRKKKQS
jgi:hypothetical protein